MKSAGAFLLLVTIAWLQSCKKEYRQEKESDHVLRLSSVKNYHLDGTFYTVAYQYNNHGQLTSEKQIGGDSRILFETVLHYKHGRLEIEELGVSPKISEFRYTYKDQLLSETEYIEHKSGPIKHHFKRTFIHENSRLTKIIEKDLENDDLSNYRVLTYTGGNLTNIKMYDIHTSQLLNETKLEYDNKRNPFYGIKESSGNALYLSRNNVTQQTMLVKNGAPVEEITTYEFEYNTADYPVKKSHVFTSGGKLLEQTYTYQ